MLINVCWFIVLVLSVTVVYVECIIKKKAHIFSTNIRYLRRECGIQQAELAKMSGVSREFISEIECRRQKLSLMLYLRIRLIFRMRVKHLGDPYHLWYLYKYSTKYTYR